MAQRKAKGIQINIPPPDFLAGEGKDKYNHPVRPKTLGNLKYAIPILVVLCVLWGEIGVFYCMAFFPPLFAHLSQWQLGIVSQHSQQNRNISLLSAILNSPTNFPIPIISRKLCGRLSNITGQQIFADLWFWLFSDVYMQRYYWAFMRQQEFKATIFLGDLFDGVTAIMKHKEGRYWNTFLSFLLPVWSDSLCWFAFFLETLLQIDFDDLSFFTTFHFIQISSQIIPIVLLYSFITSFLQRPCFFRFAFWVSLQWLVDTPNRDIYQLVLHVYFGHVTQSTKSPEHTS